MRNLSVLFLCFFIIACSNGGSDSDPAAPLENQKEDNETLNDGLVDILSNVDCGKCEENAVIEAFRSSPIDGFKLPVKNMGISLEFLDWKKDLENIYDFWIVLYHLNSVSEVIPFLCDPTERSTVAEIELNSLDYENNWLLLKDVFGQLFDIYSFVTVYEEQAIETAVELSTSYSQQEMDRARYEQLMGELSINVPSGFDSYDEANLKFTHIVSLVRKFEKKLGKEDSYKLPNNDLLSPLGNIANIQSAALSDRGFTPALRTFYQNVVRQNSLDSIALRSSFFTYPLINFVTENGRDEGVPVLNLLDKLDGRVNSTEQCFERKCKELISEIREEFKRCLVE